MAGWKGSDVRSASTAIPRRGRFGCGHAILAVVAVFGLMLWALRSCISNGAGCDRSIVAQSTAPDASLIVEVLRETCTGLGSFDNGYVLLHPPGGKKEPKDAILRVQINYEVANIPRLAWDSSHDLVITLPLDAWTSPHREVYRSVHVTVKFDPDDPVARQKIEDAHEKWARELNERLGWCWWCWLVVW